MAFAAASLEAPMNEGLFGVDESAERDHAAATTTLQLAEHGDWQLSVGAVLKKLPISTSHSRINLRALRAAPYPWR